MDDVNFIVHHTALQATHQAVKPNIQQLGLQLNDSKTECWINPTTVAMEDTHNNFKRTARPMVLKNTTDPTPIRPDTPNTTATPTISQSPEHLKLVTKRQTQAKRLQQLHDNGLTTHVAQALWRTNTASDATYTARATGLDTNTAQQLDQITIRLYEQWIQEQLTEDEKT